MVLLSRAQKDFYFSFSVPGCTAAMASDHCQLLNFVGSNHFSNHSHALYNDCKLRSMKAHHKLLLLSLPAMFVADWRQRQPLPHTHCHKTVSYTHLRAHETDSY